MEGSNNKVMLLLFLFSFALLLPTLLADYEVEDEFVQLRKIQARQSFLDSFHPDPHHVVTHLNYHVRSAINETHIHTVRRSLKNKKKKYEGPCLATNPIDQCWRCRDDWEQDRKRLATCVLGFGRKTTGGAAGEIYTVVDPSDDNVADPKPGTLRWGVIQNVPLWIVFGRSMTIKLTQELMINCNKTIDGRGVHVRFCGGGSLTIQYVQNVIVHGIKIFDVIPTCGGIIRDSVDHCGFRTPSDGDGITIFGSSNVWLDHITMRRCADGLIDVVKESTAVTISNCYFSHHSDVMLLGASDKTPEDAKMQVTVAFNHFGKGLTQRMPRCRFGFFHVVNNEYTHWLMYAIGGSSHPVIVCQGNRFTAPPNPCARNVAHRQYAPESEWYKWSWTSQEDLLLNGAVFITSGVPPSHGFVNGELIPPRDGSFVKELCMFVGSLQCAPAKGC